MDNKRINEIDKEIEKLLTEKQTIIDSNKTVYGVEVDNYLKTYSGKRLLEFHSMEEVGTWKILGQDPNCDMGGSHHNPYLETVEGKLLDVIKHAISLDSFYTWGGGGEITKITVTKLNG